MHFSATCINAQDLILSTLDITFSRTQGIEPEWYCELNLGELNLAKY